jgi:hypothetical protein
VTLLLTSLESPLDETLFFLNVREEAVPDQFSLPLCLRVVSSTMRRRALISFHERPGSPARKAIARVSATRNKIRRDEFSAKTVEMLVEQE